MAKHVKKNFSFDRLATKLAQNIVTGINELGKSINREIGVNLKSEIDIDEKPFKPLKESTLEIKQKRGFGDKILHQSGKMGNRRLKQATITNPEVTIHMTHGKKGYKYGGLHHTGYITDSKSMIPNKKVPARRWFGIPKTCRPGGAEYKKATARTILLNRLSWKK